MRLTLIGPTGVRRKIYAVIDTGFTGTLTLPAALVRKLGLEPRYSTAAVLPDGSQHEMMTYGAEIDWDNGTRGIVVSEFGTEVLAGVTLFAGHVLTIEMQPGGRIQVIPIDGSHS